MQIKFLRGRRSSRQIHGEDKEASPAARCTGSGLETGSTDSRNKRESTIGFRPWKLLVRVITDVTVYGGVSGLTPMGEFRSIGPRFGTFSRKFTAFCLQSVSHFYYVHLQKDAISF